MKLKFGKFNRALQLFAFVLFNIFINATNANASSPTPLGTINSECSVIASSKSHPILSQVIRNSCMCQKTASEPLYKSQNDSFCKNARILCENDDSIKNTPECTKAMLGIHEVNADNTLTKVHPYLYIQIGFYIAVAIVILYMAYSIVVIAFKVANAGEDKEKVKEAFKEVGYKLLAVFIAMSVGAVATFIPNLMGIKTIEPLVDCDDMRQYGYDEAVIQRCESLADQLPKFPAGSACQIPLDCQSGQCVNNVCQ